MDETLDTGVHSGGGLTNEGRAYLLETAKWARFLAIVGFVFIGLMIIAGIFMGSIMGSAMGAAGDMGMAGMMGGGAMTVLYILLAALYFFPTLYLYRFATQTRAALSGTGGGDVTQGLGNLKSTFKFMGILMIVIIALYALLFIGGLIFGASMM